MLLDLSKPLEVITAEEPPVKYFDIFIPTGSGEFKRITMPETRKRFLHWILDPESLYAPEVLHQLVSEKTEDDGQTYADRLECVLKEIMDDPTYSLSWCEAQRDEKYWLRLTARCDHDQRVKGQAWRKAHNNWDVLPPAFD